MAATLQQPVVRRRPQSPPANLSCRDSSVQAAPPWTAETQRYLFELWSFSAEQLSISMTRAARSGRFSNGFHCSSRWTVLRLCEPQSMHTDESQMPTEIRKEELQDVEVDGHVDEEPHVYDIPSCTRAWPAAHNYTTSRPLFLDTNVAATEAANYTRNSNFSRSLYPTLGPVLCAMTA